MANVIVACEFSGIVREAFAKYGHYVMSVDLLETEQECSKNAIHNQCDIKQILGDSRVHWDLLIGHPPCTYLCNSGVRHLYQNKNKKKNIYRWKLMKEGCEFFNYLKNQPIKHICLENPIPHKYARELIGSYTQIIQPYQFEHLETKSTCLWLKNLPKLLPTKDVKNEMLKLPKNKTHKVHYSSPSVNRWKERSRTFQGFADAMAEQRTISISSGKC